jgi:hypothetical protein
VRVENETFDFGNVTEGELVSQRIYLTNIGETDLWIQDISAPCVTADFSLAPIRPEERSYIDITFSTQGKVGSQYREVPIKGNIEHQAQAIIYIQGVVYPK